MTIPTANSALFRAMADRIDHNKDFSFGGAVVIIPPPYNGVVGDPIEMLLLDAKADPAQFWGNLLTRIQLEVNRLQDSQQIQNAFGGRR